MHVALGQDDGHTYVRKHSVWVILMHTHLVDGQAVLFEGICIFAVGLLHLSLGYVEEEL